MSSITNLLFYSQLVDNATSVFCSHWDPLANGMSKIDNLYLHLYLSNTVLSIGNVVIVFCNCKIDVIINIVKISHLDQHLADWGECE